MNVEECDGVVGHPLQSFNIPIELAIMELEEHVFLAISILNGRRFDILLDKPWKTV